MNTKIYYAAGLFDGEGYVRICGRKSRTGKILQIYAGVAMTDPRPLIFMQELFGGSIGSQKRTNPNHKTLHGWAVSSQKCAAFLRQVQPFLLVKKEQADLALEFQSNVDKWAHKLGNRYYRHPERDSVMAYREHLASEILRLKSVVIPLVT